MNRYQQYKKASISWLKEVPSHWAEVPLKVVASCNDEVLPESTEPDKQINYVEISDVSATFGIENITPMLFSNSPSRARRIVKNGDILVSTVRTYLKAITAVENVTESLVASTGFAVIRPRSNIAISNYLGKVVLTDGFIGEIISQSVGVSYPAINASAIMQVRIPLPPVSEQQKIAQFLDYETAKIDALIDEQKRLIELLKEKRQAVISHAVTKGLNPDAPMKDSGVEWLGEVPEHWMVVQLKRVSTINDEALSENTPADTLITYVEIGDIDNTQKISNLTEYEFQKAPSRARRKVRNGDVIISTVRTYLKAIAAINDPPQNMVVSTGFAVLRPIEQLITPEFLGYSIRADGFISEIIARSVGVSYPAINASDVHGLKIAVPDLKEQKEIGEWISSELNKLEILSSEVLRLISHLQERRSALISAAVTGKIDVRDWQPPVGSDTVDSNASVQTERHYG